MMVYLPDKSSDDVTLVPHFRRIIDLYCAGILGDNAEVWINPSDPKAQMFWTLTDRSNLLYFFETDSHSPGYVQITNGRVRWAPTYDGSGKDPVLDLDLTRLRDASPGLPRLDAATNFTLVVNSAGRPGKTLTPVDHVKKEMIGGWYRSEQRGITVIDLPRYRPRFHYTWQEEPGAEWVHDVTPPENHDGTVLRMHTAPSDYDQSHAVVQGTELLTSRMLPENRMLIRANIKEHAVELTPAILNQAESMSQGVFKSLARGALDRLAVQLRDTPDLIPEPNGEGADA